MISIYAQSFMTATRTGAITVADATPRAEIAPRRRWLPGGHWWLKPEHGENPCAE